MALSRTKGNNGAPPPSAHCVLFVFKESWLEVLFACFYMKGRENIPRHLFHLLAYSPDVCERQLGLGQARAGNQDFHLALPHGRCLGPQYLSCHLLPRVSRKLEVREEPGP